MTRDQRRSVYRRHQPRIPDVKPLVRSAWPVNTCESPHEKAEKRPQPPKGLRPNGWPLRSGLVGEKFGGIDLGSWLPLLLSTVEFEDAVDLDLGDPMLDRR